MALFPVLTKGALVAILVGAACLLVEREAVELAVEAGGIELDVRGEGRGVYEALFTDSQTVQVALLLSHSDSFIPTREICDA